MDFLEIKIEIIACLYESTGKYACCKHNNYKGTNISKRLKYQMEPFADK